MKNLKKISLGAFAFFFGLTLVLTQSAFKSGTSLISKRAPVTVYYHGPNFSQTAVQNEANWTTTSNDNTCAGEQLACSLIIDDSFVVSGTLQSSANLTAAASSPNRYYVEGSDDGDMQIFNRAE
jgi:hypothetical protein